MGVFDHEHAKKLQRNIIYLQKFVFVYKYFDMIRPNVHISKIVRGIAQVCICNFIEISCLPGLLLENM